jgi:cephalosporin hydroxylase
MSQRFKVFLKNVIYIIKKKIQLFTQKHYPSPETELGIATLFNQLYYDAHKKTWADTRFLGTPVLQSVSDLWVYQEIIYERRPDVIVECGTHAGGCALYLASLCELIRNGTVLSIDTTEMPGRPDHERITYLTGSSTSDNILENVKESTAKADRVMVLLDSDHTKDHVLEELRNYGQFVTAADYLIVEDTNINGHPVRPDFGPGPMEAVQDFLAENDSFAIDVTREKFFLTFNPKGYLKKIK